MLSALGEVAALSVPRFPGGLVVHAGIDWMGDLHTLLAVAGGPGTRACWSGIQTAGCSNPL